MLTGMFNIKSSSQDQEYSKIETSEFLMSQFMLIISHQFLDVHCHSRPKVDCDSEHPEKRPPERP